MSANPVILYVEDEARSRKVMHMITSDMGLEHVNIFEDSTDFLARAKQLNPKPSVILLDIHVLPLTGFDMIQLLRSDPHFTGIPIVALTASVMNEEVIRLKTAGFDSCLAKPLDMDSFPDMLQRILNGESIWRILS